MMANKQHPVPQHVLTSYYRLPDGWETASSPDARIGETGFFQFGSKIVCYGESESGVAPNSSEASVFDAAKGVRTNGSDIYLPFNISRVIENLRLEQYVKEMNSTSPGILHHPITRKAYYSIRELLPVRVRRYLQRSYFNGWRKLPFPKWPVDFTVDNLHEEYLRLSMEARGVHRVPFIWFWPNGASSALILTHDVETSAGRDFTPTLMDLDASHGFRSSIQAVPEKRYEISDEYVAAIRERGFEFNVHDLNHDGNLYRDHEEFLRRVQKINAYVRKYEARGFRSGAMYRNLAWYDAFEFSYDMSTPNVAHLEPQRGGCCTVMPYFVGNILELPLTTSQDYSLFHILNDYSIDLWKEQIELIHKRNGLISFITHPDYLIDERARRTYAQLLDHLRRTVDRTNIWAALPGEVDAWWRSRNQMKLVRKGDDWAIEGPDHAQARVAYAILDRGRLHYDLAGVATGAHS
jgi:hypothetical protein